MPTRWPTKWKPLKYTRGDFFRTDLTRKRHPVIMRRGTREIYRPPIGESALEKRATQGIIGSLEERIVYKELLKRKIYFSFQSSMEGGRQELGGMVVDFIIPERRIALRVQGTIWHTGPEAEARDLVHKAVLENEGYTVLDLWDWQVRDLKLFNEWMDDYMSWGY